MQYEHQKPVTKPKRQARRDRARKELNDRQEQERRDRAAGGGKPGSLGVTQGQNGEQGNTSDPRNTAPLGTPGED